MTMMRSRDPLALLLVMGGTETQEYLEVARNPWNLGREALSTFEGLIA